MKIVSRWNKTKTLFESVKITVKETLIEAIAKGADLQGADLRDANLQGADLQDADLRYANLQDADLQGADLQDADLQDADLRGADLQDANLQDADLQDADLQDAKNLPTIPAIKKLDSKILEAITSGGTLEMGAWHKCETTHCRAGWAIVKAGKAGKKLEAETSSYLAGWLIYKASYPDREPPNFFATNEEALAGIKESAAKEQ